MTHLDAGVLTLGAALVTATGGGAWKLATLRSDLISDYRPRLTLAQARLDEQAFNGLQRLAVRVSETLGGLDAAFDPLTVVSHPTEMLDSIVELRRILRARQRLPKYLRWLVALGAVLPILLGGACLALFPTFAYFSGAWHDRTVGIVALYVVAILLGAAIITGAAHVLLHNLFGGIEALAIRSEA